METSAEFWRGADWQWVHGATRAHIAEELAAAEAREAGEPTAAEVIAACEKELEIARRQFGSHAGEQANEEMCEDALALIARWKEANGGK